MKIAALWYGLLVCGPVTAQSLEPLDWAGLYVGANFSSAQADVSDNYDSSQLFKFSVDGTALGAQLGYNLQRGFFVVGLEADVTVGSIAGIGECPPPTCVGTGSQPEIDIERRATVRARVGIAHRNMLYFATLGRSFADANVNDPFQGGSDNHRHQGVLAGIGVDWKFSDKLSAGAEYTYGRYEDIPYALIITPDVIGFETRELRLGVKVSF